MPCSMLFTRTTGSIGIICSSITKAWSTSVSAKSIGVLAGTEAPAC